MTGLCLKKKIERLCRATLQGSNYGMVTINKNVGLLTLLDTAEREAIERKLRKRFQSLTDYVSFLEEEIASLEWDLDRLLKGDKHLFASEDAFALG